MLNKYISFIIYPVPTFKIIVQNDRNCMHIFRLRDRQKNDDKARDHDIHDLADI